MNARQDDNPLHRHEQHLFEALDDHYEFDVSQAIKTISKHPQRGQASGPKLTVLDDDNKSFLYLAIEYRLLKNSAELWGLLENDTVLGEKSSEGNSLVSIAAQMNTLPDLEQGVAYFNRHKKEWMAPNHAGDTPLHFAAVQAATPSPHIDHARCLQFLLKEIGSDPKKLNAMNKQGETALFQALCIKGCDPRAIQLLLKSIQSAVNKKTPLAWFFIGNNAGQRPEAAFLAAPIDTQMAVFKAMDKDFQTKLLTQFFPFVRKNRYLHADYFKLCAAHSLQSTVIAQLNLNQKIPKKETYELTIGPDLRDEKYKKKRKKAVLEDEHFVCRVKTYNEQIPDDIKKLIPFYFSEDLTGGINEHYHDVLEQSRDWINERLDELTRYIQLLQARRPYSVRHRAYILGPIATGMFLLLGTLIGCSVRLGIIGDRYRKSCHGHDDYSWACEEARDLEDSEAGTLVVSLVTSIALMAVIGMYLVTIKVSGHCCGHNLWNRSPKTNHHDHDFIITRIQLELINQLLNLPIEQSPFTQQEIETWVQALDDVTHDHPLDQTITKLQHIQTLLQNTLAQVNVTQVPLTFFSKPNDVVVEMDDAANLAGREKEEEKQPLMLM